jgi:hypothetical protein
MQRLVQHGQFSLVKDKRESYKNLRGANLVVMAHEQFG